MSSTSRIIPFEPGHVLLLDFSDSDAAWIPNPREQLPRQANGNGYTLLIDGRVACIWGATQMWTGFAEAWMIPSRLSRKHPRALGKAARWWFAYTMQSLRLRRLQCHVKTSDMRAIRWATWCGFEREGTCRCYGHDGSDYELMAIARTAE